MNKRTSKVDKASSPNQTLGEEEIKDLFDKLKLSTAADREKFLRVERLFEDPDPEDRPIGTLRVLFGDSTATTPTAE